MKSIINLMVFGMLLTMYGCSGDSGGESTTAPAAAPEVAAPAPETAKAPEPEAEMEKPDWAKLEQNVIQYSSE